MYFNPTYIYSSPHFVLQKIILRLKKPSDCVSVGPEDDESEFVSRPSEYSESHRAYMHPH